MSTENTPSATEAGVTVSFKGGAWQWDDGTATCHGYASAAEAAADYEAGSAWKAVASLVAAAHGRPDPRWL